MLNKLIDNQARDVSPCEKVLGSTPRVNNMASVWDKHATLFKLIAAAETLEFAEGELYTPGEAAAFRLGVGKIGAFLESCSKERQTRIQQESLQDSK